jgi:ferredoxin
MDIFIDYSACEGCGACPDVYPELFEMRGGVAWILDHERLSEKRCHEIARVCPFRAITVSD